MQVLNEERHAGHGLAVPGGGPRTSLVEHNMSTM